MVNNCLGKLWKTVFFFQDLTGHSNPGQNICSGSVVLHKHVTFMKYAEYYLNFLFKYGQLWLQKRVPI